MNMNSILLFWLLFINKFRNLIYRPVMNCSMRIPSYFYFSDNILKRG